MSGIKDFFSNLKKVIINFIGNIRIYSGGIVFFGHSGYKLKGPDWRSVLSVLKVGDIVLNSHDNYVSSFFIKGEFGHSGIYVGDNSIIHVMTQGIIEEDILTFMRADRLAVVRYKDESKVKDAILKARTQLEKGVKYDYDFDKHDTEQFYCTEFTDYCYDYPIRDGVSKNKKYILPDDYLKQPGFFDIIWKKQ